MTRKWLPDPGWIGHWELPELLKHPISTTQRGALVALACAGMGPAKLATSIAGARRLDDVVGRYAPHARNALRGLARIGARAIVPSDDEYPDPLAAIDAAPPVLFVRGERLDGRRPAIAIVGARACTTGAARFAERLGASFAAAGFVVVSGLARGIDAAAHRGALQTGRSIAVLGTGIDVCYPSEHRELAVGVRDSGALVTEFPPGVGPRAWHFPSRNRIISGLSVAVIVVEAGTTSGALITAGFALDQGREVFASTTGPENPAGAGVRELLRDGARLVVDPEQAVEDALEIARIQGYIENPEVAGAKSGRLVGELQTVYEATGDGATADDIASVSALPVSRVASALSELELDGLVELERGRWRRAGI